MKYMIAYFIGHILTTLLFMLLDGNPVIYIASSVSIGFIMVISLLSSILDKLDKEDNH